MVYNEVTTRTLGARSLAACGSEARDADAIVVRGFSPDLHDSLEAPPTSPVSQPDSDDDASEPPARLLEPGDRFNRYRLEERLGMGGMGAVFRARDDLLQRRVALKVILPDYGRRDPAAGLRFLREAEIVAGFDHPHIIRILDAGLDGGIAFMTFEFVEGSSLSQRIRTEGPMSTEEAVSVLLPVASAMTYAHARGVVHGDMKPTNVILGRDHRGHACPKVLDFGVSFFASVDARLDPTRSRVAGTPGYLAPERLTQGDVDARLDCFSLGCVLYECLTGRGPFSHCKRLSEAALAAHNADYVPPSRVRLLPPEVDHVVARALAPRPSDRYATVAALARDLLCYAPASSREQWALDFAAA
jgi:eukaryotic-like serine/threonine-protein kinase